MANQAAPWTPRPFNSTRWVSLRSSGSTTPSWWRKQISHDPVSVGEYLKQLPFDSQPVHKPAAEDFVPHTVLHKGSLALIDEGVLVNPLAVRALALKVFKSLRGLPVDDLGTPFHGKAVDFEFVVDESPPFHLDLTFGDNLELEQAGGNLLEVSSV